MAFTYCLDRRKKASVPSFCSCGGSPLQRKRICARAARRDTAVYVPSTGGCAPPFDILIIHRHDRLCAGNQRIKV